MHALIVDQQMERLNQSQIALMDAGLQVTGSGCIAVAETCITRMPVDILILDRTTLGDALGDVIGAAEDRNSHLACVLRSSDVATDLDELADAFPSLHVVLGQKVSSDVLIHLCLASLHQQSVAARLELEALQTPPLDPHLRLGSLPAFQRSRQIQAAAS